MGAKFVNKIGQAAKSHLAKAFDSARLFYNYLRMSPSYAAGCFYRASRSRKKLNTHGAQVLKVVKTYQDVHQVSFKDWIEGPGSARIHVPSLTPEVITAKDLANVQPTDLLIRFPMGLNCLTTKELMALISSQIPANKRLPGALHHPCRIPPAFEKNLWRDIYLAYLMKNYPDTELWRLGAEAMLVERFIGKVEPNGRKMNASQDHERRLLLAMVLRHRVCALNVSECAALDNFPCKDALPLGQQSLDLASVDLIPYLAQHSEEESMFARQQVILCTGAMGKVSMEPSFKHQGILF